MWWHFFQSRDGLEKKEKTARVLGWPHCRRGQSWSNGSGGGGGLLEISDACSLASCELGFVTSCSKPSCGFQVPLPNCKAKVFLGLPRPPMTSALLASLSSPGATSQALNFFLCLDYTMPSAPAGFCYAVPCASDTLPSLSRLSLSFSALGGLLHVWIRDPPAVPSIHCRLPTITVWWLVGLPAGPRALEGKDSGFLAQCVFPGQCPARSRDSLRVCAEVRITGREE